MTVVTNTEGYMHLLIGKNGKKWRIKSAKENSLMKVFLFQKRKKLRLEQVLLITLMKILPLRRQPVSILSVKVLFS